MIRKADLTLNVLLLILLIFFDVCFGTNRIRHRYRKQAVDGSSRFDYDPSRGGHVTSNPIGNTGNQNSNNQIPQIPWPGSDNNFPFISQWGAWTQQQIQQGSGQKYVDQAGKIQIGPAQAQWYPNSPEYNGIRPAPGAVQNTGINMNVVNPLTGAANGQQSWPQGQQSWPQGQPPLGPQQGQQENGRPIWQQGQQQNSQQNWQQGQQQNGQQNWQQGQQQTGPQQTGQQTWQQALPRDPQNPVSQNVIYFPLPNTTTLAPGQTVPPPWSTWTEVKQQGAVGGMMSQWQNWYMNPDVWAQWQEWMVLQQRKTGEYVNGPDGRAINVNITGPDDTFKILVDILAGFVGGSYPRRVAMYNAKTYYPQYRRDYWVGLRYYPLDPQSVIDSYFTCIYAMPPDINVLYEIDNTRIKELVFQCVKYQETCCNLNCCDMKGQPLYYSGWGGLSNGNILKSSLFLLFSVLIISFKISLAH